MKKYQLILIEKIKDPFVTKTIDSLDGDDLTELAMQFMMLGIRMKNKEIEDLKRASVKDDDIPF